MWWDFLGSGFSFEFGPVRREGLCVEKSLKKTAKYPADAVSNCLILNEDLYLNLDQSERFLFQSVTVFVLHMFLITSAVKSLTLVHIYMLGNM